ncbi:metallopeptidase family protein [Zhihengliuella sp.]|uniref:metallopeptidase family protein n=1 Tax=Zhihengliuella sp. TaxID=1954483 RepID=UPI0028126982|nr:metallopeptidase family protein [Zhihengliuella sp.]
MGSFTFDSGSVDGPPNARGFWRRRRNRHGRGLRGPLLLPQLPGSRTRQERFEELVAESELRLEQLHPHRLSAVQFLVSFAPEKAALDRAEARNASVPLGRSVRYKATPADAPGEGGAAKKGPREEIVVYRKPVEELCLSPGDLPDLVHDVLVELVGELLDMDPYDVDPAYGRSTLRGPQ